MRSYFMSDVELGKKDDDHSKHRRDRSSSGLGTASTWLPSRGPRRRSLKGAGLLALFVFLVYVFVKNLPVGSGPNPLMRRPSFERLSQPQAPPPRVQAGQQQQRPPPPLQAPDSRSNPPSSSSLSTSSSSSERTYNGPVKFLELASSLHAIAPTKGSMAVNKNVLFAVSSLKSAAALLPVACQMGIELKNYVHFALMSRSDIDLAELQKLNGIDDSCHLIFHGMNWEKGAQRTYTRPPRIRLANASFVIIYQMLAQNTP